MLFRSLPANRSTATCSVHGAPESEPVNIKGETGREEKPKKTDDKKSNDSHTTPDQEDQTESGSDETSE